MASANIKLYNQDGNIAGDIPAPAFLSAHWNAALAHQAFKASAANERKPIAHTKNRGEVSGGGIKPWKQKGTGRARQGSIRSPLWRHGGVTFGPRKTTDYSQRMTKQMRRQALASALSKKLAEGELKIVNSLASASTKTKDIVRAVENLGGGKSTLVVLAKNNANARRAMGNINRVATSTTANLNTREVLAHKMILIEQPALAEFSMQ